MNINIYKSVYFTDAIIDKLPNLADKLSKTSVSRPSAERELQTDSFLFRLPAEIRNVIYELVLGHQTFQINHAAKFPFARKQDALVALPDALLNLNWESWRTNDAVEWPGLYETFRLNCKHPSNSDIHLLDKATGRKLESCAPYNLSLLRTCRRIYSETRDLPYITSTIKAASYCPSPPLFLWRMTDHQTQLIKSLHLSIFSLNFSDLIRIYLHLPELRNLRILWHEFSPNLRYPRGHAIMYCWDRLSCKHDLLEHGLLRGFFITSMEHNRLESAQVIFEALGLPPHLNNKDISTCFEAFLLAKGENAWASLVERFAPGLTVEEICHGGVSMQPGNSNIVQSGPS